MIEEVRKTETTKRIETKLSTAEQNREKEIQRKLEVVKKNVCIIYCFICFSFCLFAK